MEGRLDREEASSSGVQGEREPEDEEMREVSHIEVENLIGE